MARTARRQLEGWHLLFGEYLRSWATPDVHYQRWTYNIDGGIACLSCVFKLENLIILNE